MKNKKNLLIIEDEEDTRELLVDFFNENNYSARGVESGAQAKESMEKEVPDLVVTDLLLPGEHGIDLVRFIKDKYFIPVIIISGIYKADEIRDIMESYFVEGFFEKPVDVTNLLRKVNAILID
jgi:DNA-binding NtrC family response regulator